MELMKSYMVCRRCGKDINVTNGIKHYDEHISRHNNPSSRLCRSWYKQYFAKVSAETSVCMICDEEVYHDGDDMFSVHQYEDHLAIHGVAKP